MRSTTAALRRCTTIESSTNGSTATASPRTGRSGIRGCCTCRTCARSVSENVNTLLEKRARTMRLLPLLGLVVAYHALAQGTAGQSAAACDPVGTVQFICGVIGPEDLVVVPGSDWVIASGDAAGGAIKAINVRDRPATGLF